MAAEIADSPAELTVDLPSEMAGGDANTATNTRARTSEMAGDEEGLSPYSPPVLERPRPPSSRRQRSHGTRGHSMGDPSMEDPPPPAIKEVALGLSKPGGGQPYADDGEYF